MLKHWTEKELQTLNDNYQCLDNDKLAELIPGRTPQSIKAKLGRLGLTRGKWALPASTEDLLPEPTPFQICYFAGHFDGEGCIRLTTNGRSYKIHITVTAAHKPVLDEYLKYFGGSIHRNGGKNKPLFCWNLKGYYRGLRFIKFVLPFSMEKQEQLQVAHDYIVKRIEASMTQPSDEIRELAKLSAHRLTALKGL
jgi:hypothetical protein